MKHSYEILGATNYAATRKVLCNAVKAGNQESIKEAAKILSPCVPDKTVLVPVPGRRGYADYTFELAQEIEWYCLEKGINKDVRVFNGLLCDSHESLCEVKRAGGEINDIPLNVRFRSLEEEDLFNKVFFRQKYHVVLVDNIIDTGKTANACMDVLGDCDVLCLCHTGKDLDKRGLKRLRTKFGEDFPVHIHAQNCEGDNVLFENVGAGQYMPAFPCVGDTVFLSAELQKDLIGEILRRKEHVYKWAHLIANDDGENAHISLQENFYVVDRWFRCERNTCDLHIVMNDRKDEHVPSSNLEITDDLYRTLLRNWRKGNMWI